MLCDTCRQPCWLGPLKLHILPHDKSRRWFANRTYDNAQVTVSSCGRLQNTGVPAISVRSAATSDNFGPYGCVKSAWRNCASPNTGFTTTFTAAGDTFY